MNKIISYFLLFHSFIVVSQDSLKATVTEPKKDSAIFKDIVLKSKIEVNTRTVFMSTINDGSLKDDYALASGIGIGIVTKSFYGFQAGVSSFVTYNLLSSDLNELDKTTLGLNRYETGLFDVTNTKLTANLIRVENLYLKYSISKESITVGKMKLNSPFINPQDGRMNTTIVDGAWLNIEEFEKIKIRGGWIWNISPRSTTQWYSVKNSIGKYPMGVNDKGLKSNYDGNLNCSGVALLNIQINPSKKISINMWDMLIDDVLNTSMIEINSEVGSKFKFYNGLMFIHQNAINNGGNVNQNLTYANKGSQSNTISGQIGIKFKKNNTSINYTHITKDGKYLIPREWGRDPFYTFMPRERNEGFGNLHAATIKTNFNLLNGKFKTGLGYGYFLLPDVKEYKFNKYGMPSYHQINFDAAYTFEKFLKGFELKFLAAYKLKDGQTYGNYKYIYNKVNMINFNLIVNYKL
jgi:hypothetical protein